MPTESQKRVWTNVDHTEIDSAIQAISRSDSFKKTRFTLPLLGHLVALVKAGAPASEFSYQALSLEHFNIAQERYDPKLDGKARLYMKRLRESLEAHAAEEGRGSDVTILIDRDEKHEENVPSIEYNPDNGPRPDEVVVESLRRFSIRLAFDQNLSDAFGIVRTALAERPGNPHLLGALAWAQFLSILQRRERPVDMLPQVRKTLDELWSSGAKTWIGFLVEAGMQGLEAWDWERARELVEEAAKRRREECWSLEVGQAILAAHGRFSEGSDYLRYTMIQERSARDVSAMADWAVMTLCAGRIEELRPELQQFVESTRSPVAWLHWAAVGEALRDRAWTLAATSHEGGDAVSKAMFRGLAGDVEPALSLYMKLCRGRSKLRGSNGRAYTLMQLALGAGRLSAAVYWLERAVVVERDPCVFWLAGWPFMRHLYQLPRFKRLVKEVVKLPAPINAV